jgi:branched-chain amino acid transport system ATP-binding protein
MNEAILSLSKVDVYYGEVQALFSVSLEVKENEIVSIIGSNGAGKSTAMRSIMGLRHARNGRVFFRGEDITKKKTHEIVGKGIIYVPEGRLVFPDMTVEENLEMGAYSRRLARRRLQSAFEEQFAIFPRLKERRLQLAGSLSGGEQQMLAIARGLMSGPELMMLDEPSLGLAPVIVDDMFDVIVKINKAKKVPVLLVEQNAFMSLSVSDRTYVLENGSIKIQGKSADLLESNEVKKAYLGG